jgi:hypothetical protein
MRNLKTIRNMLRLALWSFLALASVESPAAISDCTPAWEGTPFVPTSSQANWRVESDSGSSGNVALTTNGLQFNWNIGAGSWVQARYDFPSPVDLGQADLVALDLRGDANAPANTITVMIVDANDVFFRYDISGPSHGVNQLKRWLVNLPIPRKAFHYFWGGSGSPTLDWSRIRKFFLVVKRPSSGTGGGSGQLAFKRIQFAQAATWPRQTAFTSVNTNRIEVQNAASNAINYLLSTPLHKFTHVF